MEKSSKIYVAGHTGMVGSAIVRNLKEDGFQNITGRTVEELDLTNQQAVNDFFTAEKPEFVILAAAKVGGILANDTQRAQFIYENLMIQNNIIHSSYMHKVKKLLFLGSSCIYPKNCPQPIKEEYLLTGELEQTNEPYAIAKIAGIKMCESYYRQYGCEFISVMPTNLFGPNDNYNLETSHVLPALIRKIHLAQSLETGNWDQIRADLTKRPIEGVHGTSSEADILSILKKYGIGYTDQGQSEMQNNSDNNSDNNNNNNHNKNHNNYPSTRPVNVLLWGTGKVYREFLHVDDMAAATLHVMKTLNMQAISNHGPSNPKPMVSYLNIGTGEDQTIEELANTIKKIVGFTGTIRFDHQHPDGTYRKLLDTTRLRSLGFKPKYTLEEGIDMVYRSYKN